MTDEDYERYLRSLLSRPGPRTPTAAEDNLEATRHIVDEACVNFFIYKAGQSLELNDGSFLRICTVFRDASNAVSFGGRRLMRTWNHKGTYVPKARNELIWIVPEKRIIPFDDVKRFVTINFTNSINPDGQHRLGQLFCRLKESRKGETLNEEGSVEYVPYAEADADFRVEPAILRRLWRGQTCAFGEAESKTPVIVLDDEPGTGDKTRRKYTFGDGFCGAGGVSCGAQLAGLQLKWAFDNSEHAIDTYRLNFDTDCEYSDVFSFLTNDYQFLKVDISHGSPPCQTFSPAHTVNSVHDDANSACIFSCSDLLKKARPRIHTMEETSGLFERHKETFYRVIQDFVEIGYSVRWNVLRTDDYGVPQIRRRLVIIASGPGETLPPFPGPTETCTIHRAISQIPQGTPDHDVNTAVVKARERGFIRPPYDAESLAHTITCSGGEGNYHPSGERKFTHRELACLQTFPLSFRFGGKEVTKQIGNAVPPKLATAIFREIVRSLRDTDERESNLD
ncbi:S-adenosyl-L-methionine-dependent methyltransferase [Aspergillus avenaceus]|uniref:DNA (cytosine-5-)-methyltransferase n=1 Tax=Aspergillus avenaceus TaxID=36643 RepID=A0A5N6TY04_ASPAV|nr:S-adenosyl-L-methionine-dependent methyltransferase [Aspergillus avenaceus]